MCGIIGYLGEKKAAPLLLEGLKNLEYRGYDSCGVALLDGNEIVVRKDVGLIDYVNAALKFDELGGNIGIGHTRWGTTGGITKENAHPLLDCAGNIAVVHNGIIENWQEIKASLGGHKFSSETDTELLSHLLEDLVNNGEPLEGAAKKVFSLITGASSFVALNKNTREVVAVKNGSPLVLGIASHGNFIASDVPSFIKHTNKVIYLFDGDVVVMNERGYKISNLVNNTIKHEISEVTLSMNDGDKGSFAHFMHKEIMEQPALMKNLESVNLSDVEKAAGLIKSAKTIYLMGAGTSFYAARMGAKMLLENGIFAVPVQGQDIKTHVNVIKPDDVFIIISQSGETADIMSSLHQIKNNKKIGLINMEGSSLSREVDILIPLHAGIEKAVASTKSFTLSVVYLTLLAFIAAGKKEQVLHDLRLLNINMYNLLVPSVLEAIDSVSHELKQLDSVFFLGRDYEYIIALEGALKLKEIAYIHAEAVDAATFKHGPLALVSNETRAIALLSDRSRNDTVYNLQEVKARGGKIIGISNKSSDLFDMFIRTQDAGVFSLITQVMVMQLIAYKTSVLKGINPDKPRNLAKAVTVK